VLLPTDTVYGVGADAFTPGRRHRAAGRQEPRPDDAGPVLIGEASTLAGLV
jgi:L-threonylcarbamoyladenylate synthase